MRALLVMGVLVLAGALSLYIDIWRGNKNPNIHFTLGIVAGWISAAIHFLLK